MRKIIIILLLYTFINNIFPNENIEFSDQYSKVIIELLELYNDAKELIGDNLFRMDSEYHIPFNFGFRKNPFNGNFQYFDFITILVSSNNVYSITDGEVVEIGYNQSFGNYLTIRYNDIYIDYGNLRLFNVQAGDIIDKGQILGEVSSRFGSIGVILNLRIVFRNIPLNPELLINFDENREYYL